MPRKLIRFISIIICIGFIFEQSGFAQVMPTQGTPLWSTLPTLRYLSVNSANPFNYFNFLLDRGDKPFTKDKLDVESRKLINYFFLGLTLPGESLWVNLKPDEPGRIISDGLAETDLGRFLLEQDLQLKKDVARYIHPAHPIGKEFWEKLYSTIGKDKVKKTEITTSNRVWIVPDEAVVIETEDGAFVASAKLKVLLENDYLKGAEGLSPSGTVSKNNERDYQSISEQLMKEIILPPLTEEINKGATYAPLRQIYYSLILAEWFKRKSTQQGLSPQSLNTIQAKGTVPNPYIEAINKGYINGLESEFPWSKQKIWQDYVGSYQKGEYKQQAKIFGLRRMYFSGGVYLMFSSSSAIDTADVPNANSPGVLKIIDLAELSKAVLPEIPLPVGEPTEVTIAPTVNKIQELATLIDSAVNKDLILVLGRNNSTTNATFGEAKIPLLRTEVLDLKGASLPAGLSAGPDLPNTGASLPKIAGSPAELQSASSALKTRREFLIGGSSFLAGLTYFLLPKKLQALFRDDAQINLINDIKSAKSIAEILRLLEPHSISDRKESIELIDTGVKKLYDQLGKGNPAEDVTMIRNSLTNVREVVNYRGEPRVVTNNLMVRFFSDPGAVEMFKKSAEKIGDARNITYLVNSVNEVLPYIKNKPVNEHLRNWLGNFESGLLKNYAGSFKFPKLPRSGEYEIELGDEYERRSSLTNSLESLLKNQNEWATRIVFGNVHLTESLASRVIISLRDAHVRTDNPMSEKELKRTLDIIDTNNNAGRSLHILLQNEEMFGDMFNILFEKFKTGLRNYQLQNPHKEFFDYLNSLGEHEESLKFLKQAALFNGFVVLTKEFPNIVDNLPGVIFKDRMAMFENASRIESIIQSLLAHNMPRLEKSLKDFYLLAEENASDPRLPLIKVIFGLNRNLFRDESVRGELQKLDAFDNRASQFQIIPYNNLIKNNTLDAAVYFYQKDWYDWFGKIAKTLGYKETSEKTGRVDLRTEVNGITINLAMILVGIAEELRTKSALVFHRGHSYQTLSTIDLLPKENIALFVPIGCRGKEYIDTVFRKGMAIPFSGTLDTGKGEINNIIVPSYLKTLAELANQKNATWNNFVDVFNKNTANIGKRLGTEIPNLHEYMFFPDDRSVILPFLFRDIISSSSAIEDSLPFITTAAQSASSAMEPALFKSIENRVRLQLIDNNPNNDAGKKDAQLDYEHTQRIVGFTEGLIRQLKDKIPINEQVLLLDALLHDVGKKPGLEGLAEHHKTKKTREILESHGFSDEIIKAVEDDIETHMGPLGTETEPGFMRNILGIYNGQLKKQLSGQEFKGQALNMPLPRTIPGTLLKIADMRDLLHIKGLRKVVYKRQTDTNFFKSGKPEPLADSIKSVLRSAEEAFREIKILTNSLKDKGVSEKVLQGIISEAEQIKKNTEEFIKPFLNQPITFAEFENKVFSASSAMDNLEKITIVLNKYFNQVVDLDQLIQEMGLPREEVVNQVNKINLDKNNPLLIEPSAGFGRMHIKHKPRAGSPLEKQEGGIDLSKIELTLKDEKYISSLNPAEVKVLRAAKALKDNWDSLSLLYVHEIMLLIKDNLITDLQNKELLLNVLEQLKIKSFLDPQAMQFLNFIQSQHTLSEFNLAKLD